LLSGDGLENSVPKEQLEVYIKEVDENGDGEIDFEEF